MIDVEEILSKMNPNQKINYDRVMQKMVQVLTFFNWFTGFML